MVRNIRKMHNADKKAAAYDALNDPTPVTKEWFRGEFKYMGVSSGPFILKRHADNSVSLMKEVGDQNGDELIHLQWLTTRGDVLTAAKLFGFEVKT